jgi:hypothetical protein
MWRLCFCGHDFGPRDEAAHHQTAEPLEQEPPSVTRLCMALALQMAGCALWVTWVRPNSI